MKTIKFLSIIAMSLVGLKSQAQCAAQISYQNNPNSPTTFWADSMNGVSNTTIYTWDFGDGSTGTGNQVSHFYSTPAGIIATYNVCLTLSDSINGCNFTTCTPITFPDSTNSGCTADITYTNVDSLYTFVVTGNGSAPFSYVWTSNAQTLGVSFPLTLVIDTLNNSNFTPVCVTMTDGNGCVASDCEYVTNGNQNTGCSTYAAFTNVDSFYTFSTSTIGGNPVYWSWYIDNILVDSTASFSTVIASGSNSTVCVEIIDANGSYCQDCIYLTTSPGTFSCQAYFVIYPDSSAGITGYYTGLNLSSANQPVFWDFGDGNTSTNPYPSHTYAQPGNYIICLTVGSPNTLCYDTYCDSSFYVFKTEGGLMTQLTIESPTGINELTNNSNLKIYPNPATSELNISSDFTIERVRIYNFQGQVAQETHSTTTSVNIATLSSGVYIVEVTGGKKISRSKLIKQ